MRIGLSRIFPHNSSKGFFESFLLTGLIDAFVCTSKNFSFHFIAWETLSTLDTVAVMTSMRLTKTLTPKGGNRFKRGVRQTVHEEKKIVSNIAYLYHSWETEEPLIRSCFSFNIHLSATFGKHCLYAVKSRTWKIEYRKNYDSWNTELTVCLVKYIDTNPKMIKNCTFKIEKKIERCRKQKSLRNNSVKSNKLGKVSGRNI